MRVFRVDNYDNGFSGNFVGFYLSKDDAESNCEFNNFHGTNQPEGDNPFSQITEFEVSDNLKFDINDTKEMMSDEIWGEGEIIEDYYYTANE